MIYDHTSLISHLDVETHKYGRLWCSSTPIDGIYKEMSCTSAGAVVSTFSLEATITNKLDEVLGVVSANIN